MKAIYAALFIASASPSLAADPYGEPWAKITGYLCRIHDADTFRICRKDKTNIAIRLRGVDAPEVAHIHDATDQEVAQGKAARDWLITNYSGREVTCGILGANANRIVADCSLVGESLGALIVGSGLVRSCDAFGGGYVTRPEAANLPRKPYCGK